MPTFRYLKFELEPADRTNIIPEIKKNNYKNECLVFTMHVPILCSYFNSTLCFPAMVRDVQEKWQPKPTIRYAESASLFMPV